LSPTPTDNDPSTPEDWYLDDAFWRNFGSLMFNEDSFAQAAAQTVDLIDQLGYSPQRILDLGCGPGRHALPLASQGYPVTAVDTSRTLLDQLEQRRGELDIEVVQADMRDFERPDTYDLVVVMWTSFGYFEQESDHGRVLDRIVTSLMPGGHLILDLVGVEYLARNLEPVHLTEYEDGRLLIERPTLTDELRRLENDWLLIDGDRVHRTYIAHRVWSAGEISSLLARHGLEVEAIHGGYQGEDYDLDAERLLVIAKKPDPTEPTEG
jgi:SAM-dependent methyltransferase